MKKMSKLQFILSIAICLVMLGSKGFSAGTGDHLTMSLQNCSQPTPNTIQFDLYVVSDGASSSDLRANSFQCGINFNKAILQPGAKITTSFVKSTSDFQPLLNEFHFPVSIASDHIRIVQSVYSKGNTGVSMVVSRQYKIGTFRLTSSANWVADKNPDFELQASVVPGKTVCAAIAWVGNAASTNGVTVLGSGNSMARGSNAGTVSLSVNVGCKMGAGTISEQSMSVYPNPASGLVTVSFNNKSSSDYHLTVLDMTSREVMVKNGKAIEGNNLISIDLSNLSKGVYLVNVKAGEFKSEVRTVIE